MKRSFIFLLGLLCIIMVEAKNHYFKHLGVSDGLSQVCIFSIYQDELGAVWLGTSEGLNRYNGKDVKIFRPSQGNEGLTNNEINKLCGDKKGKVVASLLFQTFLEICRKEKYDFIVSDTNPKSVSSVTYHLRMGFKKFAMNYCKQSRSISFYIPLEK